MDVGGVGGIDGMDVAGTGGGMDFGGIGGGFIVVAGTGGGCCRDGRLAEAGVIVRVIVRLR